MSSFRLLFGLAIVVILISSGATFAQKNLPVSDPSTKPRKIKPEPPKAFKQWLEDVGPIIRPEELDAWNKLQTDPERENFIDGFWQLRDPSPDTVENEYREGYYERVAYANEHFTSGKPGYKTDRGRIYLKYGKPDEVESHPSGGSYERASYEGGGSTTTYPFERWFYRNIPGRVGVDLEFIDPTGTGEYRLARNPFQKEVTPADPLLAHGFGNPLSSRAQDSAFEWLDLIRILDSPPPGNLDYSRGIGTGSNTPVIEDNPLNSSVQISYFKQSDDRVIVAFTVQTDKKDLVFRDMGGLQSARVNISGRITSIANRSIYFEDAVSATATREELVDNKDRKLAYQKAVPLAPGRYKVDLLVRDVTSGAASPLHIGFEVPKFGTALASSSLVLASTLETVGEIPASHQFIIGDKKVIPNLSATYRQGATVGIYLQIYNAGIDQTTLRPSVDVEYALLQDSKEVGKQIEDWRGNSDAGPRLTLSRLLDSSKLAPGEYEVVIRIRDRVTGQTLTPSAKFTVVR